MELSSLACELVDAYLTCFGRILEEEKLAKVTLLSGDYKIEG